MDATVRNLYKSSKDPHRKTMLAMRKTILEIIPEAEEVVSYGMPAFKVSGNIVCGLKAATNHVGYYPFSGSVIPLLTKELKNFSITKSAIHVPIDKPLSKTLIKKLISTRISQCPVKRGVVDLSRYEKLDGYWRSIGLAAPARRGLVDNNIFAITDVKKWQESDFIRIHAIGPKALAIIRKEMRARNIRFKRT